LLAICDEQVTERLCREVNKDACYFISKLILKCLCTEIIIKSKGEGTKMSEDLKMILEVIQGYSNDVNEKFAKIEKRLDSIENLTIQNSLTIENELKPQIQIIAEQHLSLVEKINNIENKLDKQNVKYELLEMVVRSHDAEIKKLKKAN
jgi:hypothetical protein